MILRIFQVGTYQDGKIRNLNESFLAEHREHKAIRTKNERKWIKYEKWIKYNHFAFISYGVVTGQTGGADLCKGNMQRRLNQGSYVNFLEKK